MTENLSEMVAIWAQPMSPSLYTCQRRSTWRHDRPTLIG